MGRRRNNLYNAYAPLRPNALRRLVNQLVNVEVRPQLSAVNRQIGLTRKEGEAEKAGANAAGSLLAGRSNDYYGMLAKSLGGLLSSQQAAGQQYSAETAGITAGTSAALAQENSANNARTAQDVAVRGGGLQPQDALASAMGAARVNAAQRAQDIKGLASSENANYEGLIRSITGSTAMRGGELQGDIASRQQAQVGQANVDTFKALTDLFGQKADIQAQRGPLAAKYLTSLRDTEFNKYATMEGLGIRQKELSYKALNDQLNRRARTRHDRIIEDQAQQRIDATLRGQDFSHQDRVAARNLRLKLAEAGGIGGLSPKELRKLHENNAKYRSTVRSVQQSIEDILGSYEQHLQGTYKNNPPTHKDKETNKTVPHLMWSDLRASLNSKFKDADIVDAAYDLWRYGYLTRETIKHFKGRHIGVPDKWKPKGKGGAYAGSGPPY